MFTFQHNFNSLPLIYFFFTALYILLHQFSLFLFSCFLPFTQFLFPPLRRLPLLTSPSSSLLFSHPHLLFPIHSFLPLPYSPFQPLPTPDPSHSLFPLHFFPLLGFFVVPLPLISPPFPSLPFPLPTHSPLGPKLKLTSPHATLISLDIESRPSPYFMRLSVTFYYLNSVGRHIKVCCPEEIQSLCKRSE